MRSLPQIFLPERPADGLSFDIPRVPEARVGVQAAAGVISILGAIGEAVTTASVSAAIRQIGNRPLRVEINSLGGDYYEGAGIYNLLARHAAGVTVQVLGIAASAASLIAMGGRRIEIAKNAEIMIHRAALVAIGNGDTMQAAAGILERVDAAMAGVYADRTGQPVEKVAAMMAVETFMTAVQARELGFADVILNANGQPPPKASATPRNRRDLAADLKRLGYSRSAAARIAAAADAGASQETDFSQLVARISQATSDLRKAR